MTKGVMEQLSRIRKAYDLTVEQYQKAINPLDSIPEEIKNSPGYKSLIADKAFLEKIFGAQPAAGYAPK